MKTNNAKIFVLTQCARFFLLLSFVSPFFILTLRRIIKTFFLYFYCAGIRADKKQSVYVLIFFSSNIHRAITANISQATYFSYIVFSFFNK